MRPLLGAAAAWLAVCCASAAAAPPPDLDALVSYETRQVLANGTTRTEAWQERIVRRGMRVATERVLPASARKHDHDAASPMELASHKHFDAERATRVIGLDDKGQVQLQFIDRGERRVVNVPKTEWSAVGFDGRLDAAAHLVPPSLVTGMPVQSRPGAGTSWHLQKLQGWTHRVLWSDARQIALRIESQRDDGGVRRMVIVDAKPPAAGARLPWDGVAGYQQMEYDDFMD